MIKDIFSHNIALAVRHNQAESQRPVYQYLGQHLWVFCRFSEKYTIYVEPLLNDKPVKCGN